MKSKKSIFPAQGSFLSSDLGGCMTHARSCEIIIAINVCRLLLSSRTSSTSLISLEHLTLKLFVLVEQLFL